MLVFYIVLGSFIVFLSTNFLNWDQKQHCIGLEYDEGGPTLKQGTCMLVSNTHYVFGSLKKKHLF